MSKRDYYETLGLSKGADSAAIRNAHRKLVRKFHPDVSTADDAADRFSEVQEAYDVLSDDEKRKAYDQFGHAGLNGAGMHDGPQAGGNWSDVDPETFESIFGDFFQGGQGRSRGPGPGFGAAGATHAPRPRRGSDLEHELSIPFYVAAQGGTESIRMSNAQGEIESIDVKVPAGITDGATLRMRGKGAPGRGGGSAGDLRLKVKLLAHPWFRRDGLDLLLEVPISITEAALGISLDLPLLPGTITMRVPPGTSSGTRLRATGKGITDSKGKSGDFYAVISIRAPHDLDDANRETLSQLAEHLENPRAGLPWTPKEGSA